MGKRDAPPPRPRWPWLAGIGLITATILVTLVLDPVAVPEALRRARWALIAGGVLLLVGALRSVRKTRALKWAVGLTVAGVVGTGFAARPAVDEALPAGLAHIDVDHLGCTVEHPRIPVPPGVYRVKDLRVTVTDAGGGGRRVCVRPAT